MKYLFCKFKPSKCELWIGARWTTSYGIGPSDTIEKYKDLWVCPIPGLTFWIRFFIKTSAEDDWKAGAK